MKPSFLTQKNIFFLCITIVFYTFWVLPLHAQVTDLTPDISLTTSPSEPQPLESVTITAQSFGLDLTQATLTWQYNGKTISTGTGKTSVSTIAPASGSVALITLTIQTPGKAPIVNTLLLRPASVDLLWEAVDSYTPPFYKGKALLPVGGIIRVSAIPSASAPTGITYNWSRNDSAVPESSGYKKSSVTLLHNVLNQSEKISVQGTAGGFAGTGSITIIPRTPSLIAYQKIEGFTDFTHGNTSNVSVRGTGAVIDFEPYYFSVPKSISDNLSFDFSIDGESTLGSGSGGNELRFSKGTSSSATIRAAIETIQYSLQNLTRTFNLSFY